MTLPLKLTLSLLLAMQLYTAHAELLPTQASKLIVPVPINISWKQEFLDAQNQERAMVGAGLKPLEWNFTLARIASNVVFYQMKYEGCSFVELGNDPYGNVQALSRHYQTRTGKLLAQPRHVVGLWVGEKMYYNYTTNSCDSEHYCGNYKQIVWRNSTELGCAQSKCSRERLVLSICLYSPPGNIPGERPY